MRIPVSFVALLLLPSVSLAQTKEVQDALDRKLETIKFVQGLQDPSGGFHGSPADVKKDGPPSLRATSAAVRALKYLTGKPVADAVPHADKVADYVMSCYDPK